jgi:hypothetical protein
MVGIGIVIENSFSKYRFPTLEVDTHETKDCRKMLKAREIANENFRKKKSSSAYGASHSEKPDDEQQENVEDGFAASQCYAIRSVFD